MSNLTKYFLYLCGCKSIIDLDTYIEIKKKNKKWLDLTFKMIKKEFVSECQKYKSNRLDKDTFKNIIRNEFDNRKIYNYVSEMICGKSDKSDKPDKIIKKENKIQTFPGKRTKESFDGC